jgi:hypothetical protein
MRWTRESFLSALNDCSVDGICDYKIAKKAARHWPRWFNSWREACGVAGIKANAKQEYVTCTIEGCHNDTRSTFCDMCEMHYYRNRRHGNPTTKLNMQYSFNDKLYDSWTPNNAWLLGLIWSDGCLRGNRASICSKDYQLIKDASEVIGGGHIVQRLNPIIHWTIEVSCSKLTSKLRDIGLVEAKSLICEYPKDLPDTLFWDFFRGVFDGDGHASLRKGRVGQKVADLVCSFCSGSKLFVDSINAKFDSLEISYHTRTTFDPKRNKHNLFVTTVSKQSSLRVICEKMYHGDVPCLHRKRDKVKLWYGLERDKPGPKIKTVIEKFIAGSSR